MNYYIYINDSNISGNHLQAMEEYIKRLGPYCKVSVNTSSIADLSPYVSKSDHGILMITRRQSTDTSLEFADYINEIQLSGISNLHVTIGFDHDDIYNTLYNHDVISKTFHKSISAASLSSETSALLFLEQLYRGYTIIHGKTYHK